MNTEVSRSDPWPLTTPSADDERRKEEEEEEEKEVRQPRSTPPVLLGRFNQVPSRTGGPRFDAVASDLTA